MAGMKPSAALAIAVTCLAWSALSAGQDQRVEIRVSQARPETLGLLDLDGSGAWTVSNGLLILERPGTPAGPIRRPAALAIFKTPPLGRISLEVQLRSTAPVDVVNRDLELVFGYESPTRFYYVHLAGIVDDAHNGVFLVDHANRRRIDKKTTPPQLRDQAWHQVRLERDGESGRIQVYVDGSSQAAWDLSDLTIPAGRAGLGSFDDTGEFKEITLIGNR